MKVEVTVETRTLYCLGCGRTVTWHSPDCSLTDQVRWGTTEDRHVAERIEALHTEMEARIVRYAGYGF